MTRRIEISHSFVAAVEPDARLSLKPTESTSGYVTGLGGLAHPTLLPSSHALVAQLTERWGAVDRVSYDVVAWAPAARRVTAGGRQIRLDGFRGAPPNRCVHVMGAYRPVRTAAGGPTHHRTPQGSGDAATRRNEGATRRPSTICCTSSCVPNDRNLAGRAVAAP